MSERSGRSERNGALGSLPFSQTRRGHKAITLSSTTPCHLHAYFTQPLKQPSFLDGHTESHFYLLFPVCLPFACYNQLLPFCLFSLSPLCAFFPLPFFIARVVVLTVNRLFICYVRNAHTLFNSVRTTLFLFLRFFVSFYLFSSFFFSFLFFPS